MYRVLSILVALPMLMPQGVCLRKFDCIGWLLRTPATVTASAPSHVRTERANDRHPSSCRCGCQQRAAQVDEDVDQVGDPVVDLRFHDTSPPPQPQEPCCPTICKSKLDKIVQVENPQPCGEIAFVRFTPAPATNTCTPPPHRLHVVANVPPLYISYCTFLI
jgi:hypothetical protein